MSYTIPDTGKAYNSWDSAKRDAARRVMVSNGKRVKVYKDCQPYAEFWLDGCRIKYTTPCQPHTMPLPCDTCTAEPRKKKSPAKKKPTQKKAPAKPKVKKPVAKPEPAPEPIIKKKRVRIPNDYPLAEPEYKTIEVYVDPVTGKELGPVKKQKARTPPKKQPLKTEFVVDYPTALPSPKKKALPAPKKKSKAKAQKRSQKAIKAPKTSPKALPAPKAPQTAIAQPPVVYIERDGARMRDRSDVREPIALPSLSLPRIEIAPREKKERTRTIRMPKLRKENAPTAPEGGYSAPRQVDRALKTEYVVDYPTALPAPERKALPAPKVKVIGQTKGKVDGKDVKIEVIRRCQRSPITPRSPPGSAHHPCRRCAGCASTTWNPRARSG